MSKISNKVIQQINQENLKPLPKWYFLGINLLLITATFALFFLTSIFLSSFIYSSDPTGFSTLVQAKPPIKDSLTIIKQLLPFSWLIVLTLTSLSTLYLIKQNKLTYKIENKYLLTMLIIPQVLLGILFINLSLPQKIDNRLAKFGFKPERHIQLENFWDSPDDGRWVGKINIIKTNQEEIIELEDIKKQKWTLIFAETQPSELQSGNLIRLKGELHPDLQNHINVFSWDKLKDPIHQRFYKPKP